MPNYFRKPFGPGWVLVGDAGYNKDFITAQGIQDAFRDGFARVNAVVTSPADFFAEANVARIAAAAGGAQLTRSSL